MRPLTLALFLAGALDLAACSKYESSGLRGAGSMRVEVEVYKGPLGQAPAIQIGELGAVLAETVRVVRNWTDAATEYYPACEANNANRARHYIDQDCRPLKDAIESGEEIIFAVCEIFPSWVDDVEIEFVGTKDVSRDLDNACVRNLARRNDPDRPKEPSDGWTVLGSTRKASNPSVELIERDRDEIARRIAGVAGSMKSKAFRVADTNVHYVPRDPAVRDLLANFGFLVSEYSNQIQSRVAVLHKQFGDPASVVKSPAAKTFPVSDYLRDASQTDFIHLFDWYQATLRDGGAGTPGKLGPQERIRMAERLFGDYYWEKINEVYTSGQGDVSMAFIKNDLGNWDLKSFSNDPRELLAAYRDAASAALKAVVEIAANAATGGGAQIGRAQQLLTLANQITTGEGTAPATAAGLSAHELHARAAAKLALRRQQFADRAQTLQAQLTAAGAEVQNLEEGVSTAERAVATEQAARDACNPPATCTPDDVAARENQLEEARKQLVATQTAKTEAEKKRDVLALRLKELPADAAQAVRDILDDHLAVIAALQEGVAGGATQPAPASAIPVVPAAPSDALPVGVVPPIPGDVASVAVPGQP